MLTTALAEVGARRLVEGIHGTIPIPEDFTVDGSQFTFGFEIEYETAPYGVDDQYATYIEGDMGVFYEKENGRSVQRTPQYLFSKGVKFDSQDNDDAENEIPTTVLATAQRLLAYGKQNVRIGSNYTEDAWTVKRDASLSWDNGVEIASPVFESYEDGMHALFYMLAFVRKTGGTTSECSLHVNIGIKGDPPIDYMKLVVFTGIKYLGLKFGRFRIEWAKSNIDHIVQAKNKVLSMLDEVSSSTDDFETVCKRINSDVRYLSGHKYHAVNIGRNGFVEFRIIGGVGYELKRSDIKETLNRYIFAMNAAMTPTFMRREYLYQLGVMALHGKTEAPSLETRKIMFRFRTAFPKGSLVEIDKAWAQVWFAHVVDEIDLRHSPIVGEVVGYEMRKARKKYVRKDAEEKAPLEPHAIVKLKLVPDVPLYVPANRMAIYRPEDEDEPDDYAEPELV